jgi:hypothetical protein
MRCSLWGSAGGTPELGADPGPPEGSSAIATSAPMSGHSGQVGCGSALRQEQMLADRQEADMPSLTLRLPRRPASFAATPCVTVRGGGPDAVRRAGPNEPHAKRQDPGYCLTDEPPVGVHPRQGDPRRERSTPSTSDRLTSPTLAKPPAAQPPGASPPPRPAATPRRPTRHEACGATYLLVAPCVTK